MLTPSDRACLEAGRRIVCGSHGDPYVFEDGTLLVNTTAFKLEPSRDPTDALIVAISQAVQLHLDGVDLGELRRDLITAGMGEQMANTVHNHLIEFSIEDWALVRARVDFYVHDNARIAAFDTAKSGDS